MAYVKQHWNNYTWQKGQDVFQDMLNHMETGIEEASEGTGKVWKEVVLSGEQLKALYSGKQFPVTIETYDPTNFKNDYIKVKIANTGTYEGYSIYTGDPLSKVYVNLKSTDWYDGTLRKVMTSAVVNAGFDHHYYRTVLAYAGTTDTEHYILEGANVLDEDNVILLYDTTQQEFEMEADTSIPSVKPESRESINKDWYGATFVLSLQGGNGSRTSVMLVMEDTQQAYWDSVANKTKWANVEAGKIYKCTFDPASGTGAHGTERWLLTMSGSTPVQYTTQELDALFTNGVTFDAGRVSAGMVVDTTQGQKGECIGQYEKELIKVFSFNEPFEEPAETQYIEVIARPTAYVLQTYKYEDEEGITHIEEDGEYLWEVNLEGESVSLIIPKNRLDVLSIEPNFNYTPTYYNQPIYRHTFTVKPAEGATWAVGNYICNISFCAVNAQSGESTVDYLLYSDKTDQDTSWILPCSGVVGQASDTTGKVDKWHTAIRIIAGWQTLSEDRVRNIWVDYIDEEDGEVKRASVIIPSYADKFDVKDFRSEVLVVLTEEYLY